MELRNKLTVSQALKFARHDFLNHLQLVLMYIDLEKIQSRNKRFEIRQKKSNSYRYGQVWTACEQSGLVHSVGSTQRFETKLLVQLNPEFVTWMIWRLRHISMPSLVM